MWLSVFRGGWQPAILVRGAAFVRHVVGMICAERGHVVTTIIEGFVFIGLCLLVTAGCVLLIRRFVSPETLSAHNDVAGFVYATTGVIYAVILAFVVIVVWEDFNAAIANADEEADALDVMIRLADGFPDPARQEVQLAALAYAQSAVDDEWPAMADDTAPSLETTAALHRLYLIYARPEVVATINPTQYAESLSQLSDVSADRSERVLQSQGGLPGIMWVVLVGGSMALVGLAFLFGVENMRSQLAILGGLVVVLSLLLFVVYAMNNPFQGGVRVHPEGLELVLRQYGAPTATTTP